jgi:predicted nuclease of predicted toxin-antitoxin system
VNLVVDENVDQSVVNRLRAEGHDVLYAAEMEPGVDDAVVLQRANEQQALLITEDKDFGELVFRQRLVHAGVILVRLSGLSTAAKADGVALALAQHKRELVGSFSVIAPGILRIRRSLE